MSNLTGLVMLLGGCVIGWSLRSQHVWELRTQNKELRENLAYATGHPSVREAKITRRLRAVR